MIDSRQEESYSSIEMNWKQFYQKSIQPNFFRLKEFIYSSKISDGIMMLTYQFVMLS